MGELGPILLVVAFWMILGVASFIAFRTWLKVPTEMELEAAHEAHSAEQAVSTSAGH